MNNNNKHCKRLLGIEDLSSSEIKNIIDLGSNYKNSGRSYNSDILNNTNWIMLFNKSSTRTRLSFEVGISELGGNVIFLSEKDIQLGRGEPIKDTARVFSRMADGLIIRTYDHKDVEDFYKNGNMHVINALTDYEHPCQIFADLMTIKQFCGSFYDKKIVFIGDGFCNMTISWMWVAARLGLNLTICSPDKYCPSNDFLDKLLPQVANPGKITIENDPMTAVKDADVIYTDVWVSMGMEAEKEKRVNDFQDYQINSDLLKNSAKGSIVLHCLPAYRGYEITDNVLEKFSDIIFEQAENRLHAQKGILEWIIS